MFGATIAFDAMGGDHGVSHNIKAVNDFVARYQPKRLILVGDQKAIRGFDLHDSIEVVHAGSCIAMDDSPVEAIKNKKDSSLRVALELVKDGKADVAVSSGNTGAIVILAKFVLGMRPGIKRPVLAAQATDCNQRSRLFLDLGANVDCSAVMLHQFAVLGKEAYCQIYGDVNPKVALLNVGKEQFKGSIIIKEAAQILSEDNSLNYIGFVEGDTIVSSDADIIVVDGFTGNIVLKSVEGAIKCMLGDKSIVRDAILLLLKKFIKKRIILLPCHAAMLLGVKHPAFKIHGSASHSDIVKALKLISRSIDCSEQV